MENKYFKTKYLSYWARIRKEFLLPFLGLSVAILFVYVYIGQGNLKSTLEFILILGLLYGFLELYYSRQFINEIEFYDEKIIITGFNFNSRWKAELKIENSKIEIKSKSRGKGNVEYFLRVVSMGKHFDINRSLNWDYFSLLIIFKEFKKIKGEKIIFDEKCSLDFMEKKANGLSSMDIFLVKRLRSKKRQ